MTSGPAQVELKAAQEEDECRQPARWVVGPSVGSVAVDRPLAGRTEEPSLAVAEQETPENQAQHNGPVSDPPTVVERNSIADGQVAVVVAEEQTAHKAGQQLLLVGIGCKFVAAAAVAVGRQAIRPKRNTG